jgi:glycosyltransferase involved in cell wall biosynthesis
MRASLRLLMLGTVNSPHVESLATAMGERGFDVVVGGDEPPELSRSALAEHGIPVRPAPPHPRRSLRGVQAHVRWVRRLIREFEPDVVHANWLPGFAFAAALAGASPLVAMAWGSDVYRAGPLQTLANRVSVRRADLVMADSQDLLDRLVDLGLRREYAVLVNWGVDLRTFTPASDRAALKGALGLGPGPVVLSPRSLMPVYNIGVIVKAFERVRRTEPEAQLVLKHMGATDAGLAELGQLGDAVTVIGAVPYDRMADYYRAADVCVSIASSDSSPRSVWEAMACGAPCVISDLPWARELIKPGEDALIVPIDAAAVADATLRVLDDPALAASLRERGRGLVERERDSAVEMDRLAAKYRDLAAKARAGDGRR